MPVEGATHKQVVDLIRSGGDKLVLTGKRPVLGALRRNSIAITPLSCVV